MDDYEHEKDYLVERDAHRPRRSSRLRHAICYIIVIIMSMLVGVVLGEIFRVEYEVDGYIAPYEHTHHTLKDVVWYQNDTFAQEPSAITEKAWADLIPEGRGFVTHPTLAKELKSVSVFHEIHCLHGIRTAYFTSDYLYRKLQHTTQSQQSLHANKKSPSDHPHLPADKFVFNAYLEDQIKHPEHAHGLATGHVKHCFDYLRQALMCAADTNLEDTSIEDGEEGAPGWGSKRVCRDFDAVKEWSAKWRAGDGVGIV
ncbi:hypothetical protein N0V83_003195 [Neocucurbitaria cava]|uniref:Uncharacterized protein n=1 Tax=Neocucurbitaria cava TaxID=798079 RepID=A0A9W8YBU8_9PLEO|nr:hypothetical protein N0V83_003195 [Neocucurbitaria cava]